MLRVSYGSEGNSARAPLSRRAATVARWLFLVITLWCITAPLMSDCTAARYRGSVFRGVSSDSLQKGGHTVEIRVSLPVFPENDRPLIESILTDVFTSNLLLVTLSGRVVNSTISWIAPQDSSGSSHEQQDIGASWVVAIEALLKESTITTHAGGREVSIEFGSWAAWKQPEDIAVVVVPCLPRSLFETLSHTTPEDLPSSCVAGDPFIVYHKSPVQVNLQAWQQTLTNELFVTGGSIAVPLDVDASLLPRERTGEQLTVERRLRVMEGETCLHTRPAFVHGSLWDARHSVYRYTPHRGGVQSLCFTPFPETFPFLHLKLADSFTVTGPEGISTDPPQVLAGREFVATVYGTNLTELDTAVITDKLCADFTTQSVYFVELFFASSSRVSFYGSFHKRGIYHVCYHREGSPSFVRVSTVVVERGGDVNVSHHDDNVLIDQDVRLADSASLTQLKVQDKGHLDLKGRTVNVSYFVWTGGSISGKGSIHCTGQGKITTQGYETRVLQVPLHNYGEMTIDAQRMALEHEGAIHNYGNLTLVVPSMGADGISSLLSQSRSNAITNHAGGILRIIALKRNSYALLTNRFTILDGTVSIVGHIHVTDWATAAKMSLVVRRGAHLTAYNCKLAGSVELEQDSELAMMDGSAFVSTTVHGTGTLLIAGDDVLLDSLTVEGRIVTLISGNSKPHPITVSLYGTSSFGAETYVAVGNATFITSTALAKLLFSGAFIYHIGDASFAGNIVIQLGGASVVYGDSSHTSLRLHDPSGPATQAHSAVSSLFLPPHAVLFAVDTLDLDEPQPHASLYPAPPDGGVTTRRGNTTDALGDVNASAGRAEATDTDLVALDSAPHIRCEAYLVVSEFVTISGRMVARGCHAAPSGATLSGSVERLVLQDDWDMMLATACRPRVQHLISLCQHPRVPPASNTGLGIFSDFYVRSNSVIAVDELQIQSSMRAAGFLHLNLRNQLAIRAGGVLQLDGGGSINATHVEVAGTLRIGALPATTLNVGTLHVAEHGMVVLNSAQQPCSDALRVCLHGQLVADTPDAIGCAIFEDVPPDPSATHLFTSDDALALRKRVLGGLPLGITCPPEVLDRAYWQLEFAVRTFSFVTYEHVQQHTSVLQTIVWIVCGLLLVFIPCLFLLRVWHVSLKEWRHDLCARSPLRLTLTWTELGYNTWNYLGLCAVLTLHLQSSISAFHPAMPAPLPFVAMLCLRSQNLLMPHRWHSPLGLTMSCSFILAWAAVKVYLAYHRQHAAAMKRKNKASKTLFHKIMNTVSKAGRIIVHLFMFFQISIMSLLADGIACSTAFREVPTCAPYQRPWIVLLSTAAFLCAAVLFPWSLYDNQMRVSRLGTRLKIAWVCTSSTMQLVSVVMWKIFFFNSSVLSVVNLFLECMQLYVGYHVDMMAYHNFNTFLRHAQLATVSIHTTVALHIARFHLGLIHTCTDGDDLFKGILFLSSAFLFFSFWKNILYATHDSNGTTGDPAFDAMLRSILQTHQRISDLKLDVFSSSDSLQRENTLNAIAQLRIEFLEKQERYHHALDHALQKFHFGNTYEAGMRRGSVDSSLRSQPRHRSDDSLVSFEDLMGSVSPVKSTGLLTVEEMETFNCGPALGKGSYGTVHLGILSSGRLVAVKYVDVADGSPEALERVKSEVNTLRELSHPNIIRYYGAHTIGETMMVFMEFAVGGSLTSIVRKFEMLTEPVMQLYTYQILCGLQYLHQRDVVHRDIKGENILIDGFGVAKLADFGCSKSLANIASHSIAGCGTLVGSPFWMAPEVIRSEAYGTKADIWSVGCTVVEMLNGGEPPWRSEFDNAYSAMFYVGSTTDIPSIPDDTSDQCRDFLSHCFERDVTMRATADDLLQHPWLAAVRRPEVSPASPLARRRSTFLGSGTSVGSSTELSRQSTGVLESLPTLGDTPASPRQTPVSPSPPNTVADKTNPLEL